MNEDFVSVEEVAKRCRISRPTAHKRLRDGLIPGLVLHHGISRVVKKTFEKWLVSQGSVK